MKISQGKFSSLLLFSFLALLVSSVLYSEFFRPRTFKKQSRKLLLTNPIRKDILSNLRQLSIKNATGEYLLEKDKAKWTIVSPLRMNANLDIIKSIIDSLTQLNIQTIYQKDDINMQNYSLINPSVSIRITSQLDEVQLINIGLGNSIDKSTYLEVDNTKIIFQIDSFKVKLSNINLTDLMETSVFTEKAQDITEFEITNSRTKSVSQGLKKQNGSWKSHKYNTIRDESVDKKISKILNIQTKMIIDKVTPTTNNFISNYLDHPRYTLKIKTKNKTSKYIITNPILANKELKLKKRENFLVKEVNNENIYVIGKEALPEFYIRYSDLK